MLTKHPSTGAQGDARNARHKHFLALPLFVLALGTTLLLGRTTLTGQVTATGPAMGAVIATGGDRTFSRPDGTYGLLHEDAILDDTDGSLTLRDGTVLIASDGVVRLRIGSMTMAGMHGAFLATTNGDKISVWAVTTPVLLAHDAFRTIVPQSMRMTWEQGNLPSVFTLPHVLEAMSALERIDADGLRDQLRAIAGLIPPQMPAFDSPASLPEALAPFALPATQSRMTEDAAAAMASDLQRALMQKDVATAHALVVEPALRDDIEAHPAVLEPLLIAAEHVPSVAQDLLLLTNDADLWTLASFHSAFREAAWATPGPAKMAMEPRLLRWLQLPASDVNEALGEHVLDRWQMQVQKYLLSHEKDEAVGFLSALLATLRDYPAFAQEHGYPARLAATASALRNLTAPLKDLLSTEAKADLAVWNGLDDIPAYVEPPAPPSESEPAAVLPTVEPPPADPAALEAQAKQMLQKAGALFTIETTVEAKTSADVAVTNLLFASADGEHQYAFTLDVTKNEVRNVYRDGELLPYALSLEAFGAWARK